MNRKTSLIASLNTSFGSLGFANPGDAGNCKVGTEGVILDEFKDEFNQLNKPQTSLVSQ